MNVKTLRISYLDIKNQSIKFFRNVYLFILEYYLIIYIYKYNNVRLGL